MVTFIPMMALACVGFPMLFGGTFKFLVFFYVKSLGKSIEMDLEMFLKLPLEQSNQNEWGQHWHRLFNG